MGNASGQVRVSPVFTCGTGTGSTLSVAVTTLPATAGSISGPGAVCAGNTATYSITGVSGATGYSWTLPAGAGIVSGSGTRTVTVSFGSTGGTVSVVPTNGCGNGTGSSRTVAVNGGSGSVGAAGPVSGPASVCAGSSARFSVAPVAGALSYTWTLPVGASITAGVGTATVDVAFGFVGGTVTVTPTDGCGNGTSASATVGIDGAPGAAGSVSGPSNICANATGLTYSVSAVAGATSYTWSVPAGATVTAGQGTNNITVDMGATAGVVRVVPANGCGTGTGSNLSVGLTAQVSPSVAVSQTGGSNPTCSVDPVSFLATSTNGGGNPGYQWLVNGTPVSGATAATFGGSSFANGDQVSVVLASSLGCASPATATSAGITLQVVPLGTSPCQAPVLSSITGPAQVPAFQTGVTYSVPLVGGASYTWSVPAGATITAGQGTNSITVDFGGNGTGVVSVVASNSYGSTTLQQTVTVGVPTSTDQLGQALGVKVFPNPFSGSVTISMGSLQGQAVEVELKDLEGNVVEKATMGSGQSSLDWGQNLPNGLYILTLKAGENNAHYKLVKMK